MEGTVGGQLIMTDTRSMELAPELRQLLDRQAIVDLLLRYASTIDAKDYTACGRCSATTSTPATAMSSWTAATSCWRGSTG